MRQVTIVGAGLAGCEAAWQLVSRGIPVKLIEMKPAQHSPAHHSADFAELVCSNSLRSDALDNAVGVLKEEMRMLDSLIMKSADLHRVPAGSALAVDREGFSAWITKTLRAHPLVEIVHEEVKAIPQGPVIIASGPLTADALAEDIRAFLHADYFLFFDAAAPIIEKDSIDFTKAYRKSRYDKGDADYINCALDEEQFDRFYDELIHAECAEVHDIDRQIYFEGCMPVEEMARRGRKTLLFGPMKPVGLERPDGSRPYAVVQLRQDNAVDTLYNVVGFQTHLKWGEQKRLLSMIPGLEQCSIVRYGVMHRNSYLCAPKVLKPTYQCVLRDDLFFAGQLCGVEGYVESAASGLIAGINMARLMQGEALLVFPDTCIMGSMAHYITHASAAYFQPMNANFGIVRLKEKVKKHERRRALSAQALQEIRELKEAL